MMSSDNVMQGVFGMFTLTCLLGDTRNHRLKLFYNILQ